MSEPTTMPNDAGADARVEVFLAALKRYRGNVTYLTTHRIVGGPNETKAENLVESSELELLDLYRKVGVK